MNLENAFVLVIYMPMDVRIEKIIMMITIVLMNGHQLMLLLVVVVVRISAVFSSRRMRRM